MRVDSGRSTRGAVSAAIGAQLRQPGRQGAELQLAEQLDDRFAVVVADVAAVEIDLDRQIAHDRRQPLAASRLVDPGGQRVPGPRRGDLVEVGDDRLDVAVLGDQRLGRLLADAGDAGDVVRGVADERLVVGDVLGSKTVAGMDRGRVEVAQFAEALGSGQHDRRVLVDELQQVAVAGDDDHPARRHVAADPGRGCR